MVGPEPEALSRPPSPPPPSPSHVTFAKHELLIVSAIAVLVAIVTTWPLVLNIGDHFPAIGYGDPYIASWWIAWDGYALTHHPLHVFNSNTFWPMQNTLAMADATLGYAPLALIGSGSVAAVVRYNLIFILTYALAFVGAYLLAREFRASPVAAAVAGAVYAYAPFRMDQATHIHILSSGGIPLALFLLLRGYKKQSEGMVLAGWLAATWQLSIGFGLGVPFAYLLGALGVVALAVWLIKRRPSLPKHLVKVTVSGAIIFVAWGGIQALPYLRLAEEFPQAKRTEADIEFYSPPPRGLLAAPAGNLIWGDATESVRRTIERAEEKSFFPGALPVLFGVIGLIAGTASLGVRLGLGAGVVGTTILALGYGVPGGRWMFGVLFRYLPGWQGIRTPGRLMTFAVLGLALLASFGADRVRGWLLPAFKAERGRRVANGAIAVVAAVIVLEGSGNIPQSAVKAAPPGQTGVPGPQLHLPSNEFADRYYMMWSTEGFPDIANGEGGFDPPFLEELKGATVNFPDQASVDFLRTRGIESVVFHPDLAPGTPWESVPTRSIEGLPVTRTDAEGVIVYRIAP